jgi:carbon-monoxide dehydrogenase medium subunit
LQFHSAHSLEEALDLLSEWQEQGCLLAGGTDVMVKYNSGALAPQALIHIEGIEPLTSISNNGRTTIGALTTHHRLANDADILSRHPGVAAAARLVGGWQTQAVGTVGGNICNASPAADLVPPLLVADGHITLASKSGQRRVPLAEFFVDRGVTMRRPDELLTEIDLEPLPPNASESYLKLGRRGAMDVAIVGLAVRLTLQDDDTVANVRIAVCSVASTPKRIPEAENVLMNERLEDDTVTTAGQALCAAVSPIDDARGTASYRRRVLPGLLAQALAQCNEDIRR